VSALGGCFRAKSPGKCGAGSEGGFPKGWPAFLKYWTDKPAVFYASAAPNSTGTILWQTQLTSRSPEDGLRRSYFFWPSLWFLMPAFKKRIAFLGPPVPVILNFFPRCLL